MTTTFGRTFVLLRYFKQPLRDVELIRHTVTATPIIFKNIYIQCHCNYSNTKTFTQKGRNKNQKKDKKRNSVEVWNGMSVLELAHVTNRRLEDIKTALLYVTQEQYQANSKILKDKIFHSLSRLINVTCHVIKPPGSVPKEEEEEDIVIHERKPVNPADLIKRHPIITVMGHVDHGKTTLLDALRSTSVVESEFGGITQHIGAFNVTLKAGEKMTFLDTPGHAAFSAMRARGAQVTDIVILVVAADDGVMTQTIQSIEMAREANVPIVVAINKIDKPDADVKRTMSMLAQHGILVEEMGGDIQAVQISALKKTNLDLLVETVAMQAELMNLKGDPKGLAEGVVIEASNSEGRGKLATVLVQRGQLKRGSLIVCGPSWAKVRSMFDEHGNIIKMAGLSEAVQIIGWRAMPHIGEEFWEVETESKARQLAQSREEELNKEKALEHNKGALQKWAEMRQEYERVRALKAESATAWKIKMNVDKPDDKTPKVNIVVKGDVVGSVEAILDILETYNQEKSCQLNIINYGVGPVTESDISMAEAFNGIIYRFNVNVSPEVMNLAKEKKISVRPFNVIYKLIDDLKGELRDKMPQVTKEVVHGEAIVQKQFEVTEGKKKVIIAGCVCKKGVLKSNALFHVIRDGEIIHTGTLSSMKHLKQEVKSIKEGTDCGLRFSKAGLQFNEGDVIVCFSETVEKEQLEWDPGF